MRSILTAFIIGLLGVVALTGCNSADQHSKAGAIATASPATTNPADGARRITVAEAKDLLAKNEAIILDVRNEASYNAGHARGARLIPVGEIMNHLSELPKDKLIITYCS